RRVQPLDLHPRVTPDGWYFWSDRQYEEGREYHLPGMLYQYLPASPTSASLIGAYASEDEARAALSRACIHHARTASHRRAFTTGEAAKICLVAPQTMVKWFDSGRLRGYRVPGSQERRIPRENLIRFLKDNEMPLGYLVPQWEEGDLPGGLPRP